MEETNQRILDEFLELVQIDSAPKQERAMADRLLGKLKELGFSVTEDAAGEKIEGNCGNLIAFRPGNKQKPKIMFSAHMDRVSPGKGIKPKVVDGVIKSDGTTILAADDVAGIVAILEGIRQADQQGVDHGDIQLLFTIAEEGGLHGAKGLDPAALQADFGYFMDSNGPVGTIINNAPSQVKIDVTIKGKAAHAGLSPENGVNAIVAASKAISAMKLGRIDEETTANIGVISGGAATNIVPDKVTIQGEVRSRNREKLEKQAAHIKSTFETVVKSIGAEAEVSIEDCYASFQIAEDSLVIELAKKAAAKIGVEAVLQGTGGGSDANIINNYGVPSVVLGVGYSNAHSTNESIPLKSLEEACRLVTALLSCS